MLDFIQKILDATSSDRKFSVKIPTILVTIGALLLFLTDKIPDYIAQKGLIQILAVLVIIIGVILLLFSAISDAFNIPLLPAFSDGVLSGLFSTFIVSAFFFAPVIDQGEDNLYIYRISITLSYGMLYGGLLGIFTTFFDKKSKFNASKHSTVLIVFFILTIYFSSDLIFSTIPAVPTEPILTRDLFVMHALFIPIFTGIYFKTTRLSNLKKSVVIYLTSTTFIYFSLLNLRQSIFYPSNFGLDYEPLLDMTFYVNETASIYAFATIMVILSVYASMNIAHGLRTIDVVEQKKPLESGDAPPLA